MANEGEGVSLGNAHGTITIDTELDAAQAKLTAFANQATQQMTQVGAAANQAGQSFGSAAASINQFTSAFGLSISVAGAVQLGKAAIAADEVATAYGRQFAAARSLAGSQDELNAMMDVYTRDTKGAVDQVSELADIQQLLSLHLVNSAQQLDVVAQGIRAIALANNESQGQATEDVITAVFNQRRQSLAKLGLTLDEVKQKTTELQAANGSLSTEQATLAAILDLVQSKFGKLADTPATGLETAKTAASDLTKTLGEILGPTIDAIGADFTRTLTRWQAGLQGAIDLTKELAQATGLIGPPDASTLGSIGSRNSIVNRGGGAIAPTTLQAAPISDLNKAQIDWFQKTQAIERQADDARTAATAQFESQRAQIERQHQTTTVREAQDFAVSRQREERDFAQSLAQVHEETARQEVDQARQLADTIAKAQADSADRLATLQSDHERSIAQKRADASDQLAELQQGRDEDIANKREDSAKRITQIESDFNDAREKAERDHRTRVEDAVLGNDAKALYLENRNFEIQNQDRLDAHNKQIADEKAKLDDSIDQINENYQKRVDAEAKALQKSIAQENDAYDRQVSDEKKALDKRISQAQAAYDQQVADLKASDDRRTADLQAAFTQRQTDEDADRALHLTRMGEDHDAQLTELDNEQAKRITQIDQQEQKQRDELNDKFTDQLRDTKLWTDAMKIHYDKVRDDAVTDFDDFWKHVQEKITGTVVPTPPTSNTPTKADLIKQVGDLTDQQRGIDPSDPRWGALQTQIDNLYKQINAMPATAGISSLAGGIWDMSSLNRFATPAPASAAVMSGSRSVSVTFTQGSIVVNGAPGQPIEALAGIIDQRILRVVQIAAGRAQ